MIRLVNRFGPDEILDQIRKTRRTYQGSQYVGYDVITRLENNTKGKLYHRQLVISADADNKTLYATSEIDFSQFYGRAPYGIYVATDIKNDKVTEAIPQGGDVHKIILLNLRFGDDPFDYIQFGFGVDKTKNLSPTDRVMIVKKGGLYTFWQEALIR